MNKKIVVIGIFILTIVVGLSGCINNDNIVEDENNELNNFLGTWKTDSYVTLKTLTFFSDGTGSSSSVSIYWDLKDDKLVIDLLNGLRYTYDYTFTNDSDTLTLTDVNTGKSTTYIKQ